MNLQSCLIEDDLEMFEGMQEETPIQSLLSKLQNISNKKKIKNFPP